MHSKPFEVSPISSERRTLLRVPKAPEIVASRVRQQIVKGELKEGDQLPSESHLMAAFGVSRPTIREAFRILEAERLITVARGARGGAIIKAPDPDLIRSYTLLVLQVSQMSVGEIFDTRRLLEPPVARELALRHSVDCMPRLQSCLAQERTSMEDPVAFAASVASFHRALIDLSGNKLLIHLMDSIIVVIEFHQAMVLSQGVRRLPGLERVAQMDRALQSQVRLLELIEQGQAAQAEAHWLQHMEASHHHWIQGYEHLTVQALMAERA